MVKFIAGIDEAGRGPIIGPLVIAVAAISEDKMGILKENGVKDSKLLTEKQREEIFKNIEHQIKYELVIIPPQEIDDALNNPNYNLNWLEADKAADILNKIDAKLDNEVLKVVIDCPSTNIDAYKAYFRKKTNNDDTELIVEHKADVKYFPCSAASIIAKCARENHVKEIEKEIGESIGSGYMSNPICVEFLKNNWEKHSSLFRHSWQPFKDRKEGKGQKSLGEF